MSGERGQGSGRGRQVGPPRLAGRLADWLLPDGVHGRTVRGDLYEEFLEIEGRAGRTRASVWYWRQVLAMAITYRRLPQLLAAGLGQDIRHGFRGLIRSPVLSLSAVVGMALVVGVGTAIYSVVDGVLLTPLPFERPNELVRIWAADQETGARDLDFMYEDIDWLGRVDGLEAVAGFSRAPRTLLTWMMESPEDVTVARTTSGFFETFGITASVGRLYRSEDALVERPLILISEDLWTRRYGADPGVIGTGVHIDFGAYEVVGVVPDGMAYPADADIWRALTPEEMQDDDREMEVVARLGPGRSLTAVSDALAGTARGVAEQDPDGHGDLSAWLQPLRATVVRDVQAALLAFVAAVGLLLVITSVNTAGLMLARAADRRHEVAVRNSLGAGRSRIARLHLIESLMLAIAGGAAGIVLGRWTLQALVAVSPTIPRIESVSLDLRVVLVMAAVSALVGVASGVMPALAAAGTAPAESLRGGGSGGTAEGGRVPLRSALVTTEIALSTLLTAGALLLFGTFQRVLDHDRGFEDSGLVAFRIDPLHPPMGLDESRNFYQSIADGALRLGPVSGAALGSHVLLEQRGLISDVAIEGRPATGEPMQAATRMASADLFQVAGIPLLSGRTFSQDGGTEDEMELVVNRQFVASSFPDGEDPLGALVSNEYVRGRVVGVVGDVSPSVGEPARPLIYVPFSRAPGLTSWLLVRSRPGAALPVQEVWDEVRAVDPYMLSNSTIVMEETIESLAAPQRFNMLVVTAFSVLALSLAAVGIYGLAAYSISARRAELGVRRALGASATQVVLPVFRGLLRMTVAGVILGLLGASLSGRLLSSLLVDVRWSDPQVLLGVGALLGVVSLAAAALPLFRAMRIAPTEALRGE